MNGCLAGKVQKMRGNYGTVKRPSTPEAFVECVLNLIETPGDSTDSIPED